jgi:hypothetical protein
VPSLYVAFRARHEGGAPAPAGRGSMPVSSD